MNKFADKIHVLFRKEDIDPSKMEGKIVVVLDILFATTTIVSALNNGINSVVPAFNAQDAREKKDESNANKILLAGELYADTIEGFAPPTPIALSKNLSNGFDQLIYSTTNGTVAIKNSINAKKIYVGSLLNAKATIDDLINNYNEETILIICSGSIGRPNLEDTFGAGYFINLLRKKLVHSKKTVFSDAAVISEHLFKINQNETMKLFHESRVGQIMLERNLGNELDYASKFDQYNIVTKYEKGKIVKC